jgi:hypothetical protein
MLASRQLRGLLAGMGVTGSLLAAVGAGFSLMGGVLAFHSWPGAGRTATSGVLRVSPPADERQRAERLVVPAASATAPPLAVTRPAVAPRPAGGPLGASPERRRTTTRIPQAAPGTAVSPSPQPPSSPPPSASSPSPVADAVETTTGGVARSVRDATQSAAAGALAAPGEQAATVIEQGGRAVADALRGAH